MKQKYNTNIQTTSPHTAINGTCLTDTKMSAISLDEVAESTPIDSVARIMALKLLEMIL